MTILFKCFPGCPTIAPLGRIGRIVTCAAVMAAAGLSITSSLEAQSLFGSRHRASQENDARRMLDLARNYLVARNSGLACAQFAILIDRYPNSLAADQARNTLSSLEASNICETQPEARPSSTDGDLASSPWRTIREDTSASAPAPLMLPHRDLSSRMEKEFRESTGDRVFFAPSSAELGAKARAVLTAQARWLKRHPRFTITLEAHADEPGSEAFNTELSARRAENVRLRLIEDGVDPSVIAIRARGRDDRVALCPESACLAQNRRVVTRLGDRSSPFDSEPPRRPAMDAVPTRHGFRN
jgi:outer membrane protein OmpA-like peptidoglycan-associated protein